jgi:hypothetical protein
VVPSWNLDVRPGDSPWSPEEADVVICEASIGPALPGQSVSSGFGGGDLTLISNMTGTATFSLSLDLEQRCNLATTEPNPAAQSQLPSAAVARLKRLRKKTTMRTNGVISVVLIFFAVGCTNFSDRRDRFVEAKDDRLAGSPYVQELVEKVEVSGIRPALDKRTRSTPVRLSTYRSASKPWMERSPRSNRFPPGTS